MASRQAIRTSSLLSSKRLINTEKQVDENHSQHNFCENYECCVQIDVLPEAILSRICGPIFGPSMLNSLL